jgi:hypothetical protein
MDQIHTRLLPRCAGGETVQPVEFHFRENPPFDFFELDVLDDEPKAGTTPWNRLTGVDDHSELR